MWQKRGWGEREWESARAIVASRCPQSMRSSMPAAGVVLAGWFPCRPASCRGRGANQRATVSEPWTSPSVFHDSQLGNLDLDPNHDHHPNHNAG